MKLIAFVLIISVACAFPTVIERQAQENSTCNSRKVAQLVGGIEENMFIQKQELQG
jgi:hypothetical protein